MAAQHAQDSVGYRICSICEAACGLRVHSSGRQVVDIEANADDVFSRGHVCAKGIALKELDADPDRLRTPLVREDGVLREASWEAAYARINEALSAIRQDHGNDAVAAYVGNPTAHNIGLSMGLGVFSGALGSKNFYSAGTVDQVPKQLASQLMFGNDMAIPVPDIERTDCLLMLGANPVVSNGSLWVVPKVRDKLRALRERGGRLVVVDPRLTETARLADEHLFIRPGTDAWLLAALINELQMFGCNFATRYQHAGFQQLGDALAPFTVQAAAAVTGIEVGAIRALARQLYMARSPVVYGRVGTTLQAFGTLTSFLVEVINLLLGSLDRPGGAMFPEQPLHTLARAPHDAVAQGRWHSRVSGWPEVLGQLPVVALAEEIETPGAGQIRALVCFAGNPVVSNPDSDRLAQALQSLSFMVCVDIYHNETTRLADVVLPGTSAFEDSHYDAFLGAMGYRNAARYSPPLFPTTQPREWDIGLTLGYMVAQGAVPDAAQLRDFEDTVVARAVAAHCADGQSGVAGRDAQQVMAMIEPQSGVERLLDLGIRAGRWGDHFGAREGLTLAQLVAAPNGVDLGELRSDRLSEVMGRADATLQFAPALILSELTRLLASSVGDDLLLIGRRDPRANNSWLRNLPMLGKGHAHCALLMHPQDAAAVQVADGDRVEVASATGSLQAVAQLSDTVAPGVVCLPHGYSEDAQMQQRAALKGPNYNRLADTHAVDAPSATAALNGIPVRVQRLD